jgi:hypothetical protein
LERIRNDGCPGLPSEHSYRPSGGKQEVYGKDGISEEEAFAAEINRSSEKAEKGRDLKIMGCVPLFPFFVDE